MFNVCPFNASCFYSVWHCQSLREFCCFRLFFSYIDCLVAWGRVFLFVCLACFPILQPKPHCIVWFIRNIHCLLLIELYFNHIYKLLWVSDYKQQLITIFRCWLIMILNLLLSVYWCFLLSSCAASALAIGMESWSRTPGKKTCCAPAGTEVRSFLPHLLLPGGEGILLLMIFQVPASSLSHWSQNWGLEGWNACPGHVLEKVFLAF